MTILKQGAAPLWGLLFLSCSGLAAGCSHHDAAELEVEVRSVGLDQVSHSPVVVLQGKDGRMTLPIWIGPAEAQAIAMEMQGVSPPRPMTHDLMKLALEQSGIEFRKVLIEGLKESTYYARIFLRSGRKDLELDSRPSDAIALAVRFRKPIFVATTLLHRDVAVGLDREASAHGAQTYAGITMQDLSDDLARHFGTPERGGVLVSDVGGGAGAAVRRGDIILGIDGESVAGLSALLQKLAGYTPGTRVDLSVARGSQNLHVDLTVVE